MIAYLEGTLGVTWGTMCLVHTNSGVGYAVSLPSHTLANLPKVGEKIAFYTSMVVREDAVELFGFATFDERQTFETLVTISKVGARTAQSILSVFTPKDLLKLVAEGDYLPLTRVSGIGKKTAQHIFLELKDKLKAGDLHDSTLFETPKTSVLTTVVDGLLGLGYTETVCVPLVREIIQKNSSLGEADILKLALQALSSAR